MWPSSPALRSSVSIFATATQFDWPSIFWGLFCIFCSWFVSSVIALFNGAWSGWATRSLSVISYPTQTKKYFLHPLPRFVLYNSSLYFSVLAYILWDTLHWSAWHHEYTALTQYTLDNLLWVLLVMSTRKLAQWWSCSVGGSWGAGILFIVAWFLPKLGTVGMAKNVISMSHRTRAHTYIA